uniref:CD109 molecule n=1 Tax=Oreochromis aureus TaxID=47969 RepID=A0A668TCV7_OREAU
TLYLISGPEVVHTGAPTPLAVTVFADFPGTVTAELGHGSTKVSFYLCSRGKNKVFLTGITVLTLMSSLQIPDSLTQNSLLNLTVRGYKGNSVIFTNTTTLSFSPRNVSTFIRTDRSRYHPGDTVKVRAMCVQLDNHPYKDRVDLSDPSGNIVDRWESTANLGIVLQEFPLSHTAPLGRWVMAATVNVGWLLLSPLHNTFQLTFHDFPPTLKPSLHFYTNVSYYYYHYYHKSQCQSLLDTVLVPPLFGLHSSGSQDTTESRSVSSKGQVVAAGTQNSSSFSLTPALSWAPAACVTVYCILSDGEIISDTAQISISQDSYVSLNWSSERAQPGEQVSLTVTGLESRSQLAVTVMGTQDDALQPDVNFKEEGIILVPDGITSMGALALVMSENLGLGFTLVPQKVTKHFTFLFVLTHRKDASVISAQKVTVESQASASALFPVRPLALGEVEISVDAVSAEASDSLVCRVMVKPEGVEQYFSQTLFLEMEPEKQNKSTALSFSFPPNVVPGSQRARVVLVGDILALSINNLDSLVQLPLGCGEQNMIHFAPSVYVIQYLDTSNQDDQELRSKALAYMMEGYQRQLSYQREDGSFSAFGNSDTSGSTWLTAFVLRCFLQAQRYMKIDQNVLDRAVSWLLKRQGPQGEFSEVGRLIHTEMQGGLDKGPVALTAYVLIALLQDENYTVNSVSLARKYLEDKVSSGVISNYSLCLTAYALALVSSPVSFTALTQLSKRADYMGDSAFFLPELPSAQIEMASYVLLAHINRGSLFDGITQMKWLSTQRNHLGGYGTTQDTVVALQALASYAAFSGASAINLMVNVSSPESSSLFQINSTNYRTYQSQEVHPLPGLNVFYHLERETFSENQQQAADEEAFSLRIDAADGGDCNHMMLSVCTSQLIPHTGMVILDVALLSGFTLSPEAAVQSAVIRKVETAPEKVILYLDSVSSEVCINLPLVRNYKVARVHDAVVHVYDYYEPTRNAMSTYNSRVLPGVDACFFCGANCDLCRPGITIAMSAQSMAAYSFSCLFLGLTVFLFLVS